jgi:DNA primase
MIRSDSIENLKNHVDIIDVVGNYIEIKKNGANFKAVCPFHDEKTPSLVISPAKQIFKCFGCGVSGDAIKFVMEYEKLSYPESIEKLADDYHITLQYDSNGAKSYNLEPLTQVNAFFKRMLEHNHTALEYLKSRGISQKSIEIFELGFAPSSPQVINFLTEHFINLNEAESLGIVGKSDRGYYSRFIERITFCINGPNGKPVGFGGRTISGHQAKYVNSPQSKVFNKSRLLYAYDHARQPIHSKKEIIVTEGYMDVIMLHQAGFTNAVATLGTALTHDHIPLLRKGEPRIIVAYDGDDAGVNAALKAARMLSSAGFDGGVTLFGGGVDPADMVTSGRADELKKLFQQAIPFINFVINTIVAGFNLNDPKQKEIALREGITFLRTLSPLLQQEYRQLLAVKLGIPTSLVNIGQIATKNTSIASTMRHEDIGELSFIKTILDHPNLLEKVLGYIDTHHFNTHQQEFSLLKSGQFSDPLLQSIELNESIKAFDHNHLKPSIINFLKLYTQKQFKAVTLDNSLSFEQKSFQLRSLREKLERLNRGIL